MDSDGGANGQTEDEALFQSVRFHHVVGCGVNLESIGAIGTGTIMTVQFDWPSDVVDRLTKEAHQKGISLDDYVLQTVLNQNTNSFLSNEDAKRRAREEAGRSILELRKGNILGPDLTIRDLIEEGRRF
jgi:hypothetical protein